MAMLDNLLKNSNINISDNSGNLKCIDEAICELRKVYCALDTRAMSDYGMYLKGQKHMLKNVITYLEEI
jgi:hypothetical protein